MTVCQTKHVHSSVIPIVSLTVPPHFHYRVYKCMQFKLMLLDEKKKKTVTTFNLLQKKLHIELTATVCLCFLMCSVRANQRKVPEPEDRLKEGNILTCV